MPVYEIDPLGDSRWVRFVSQHTKATIFHTPEWLDALRRTYRYHAAALTTSAPHTELKSAVVFCRVESWLTGRRVVSVPFSDHCAPLVDNEEQLACLLARLTDECGFGRGRYVEIRPVDCALAPGFSESAQFCLHRLDLRPNLDEVFRGFHANSVRRMISRAMREPFVYREGRSEALLQSFYDLAVLTRRRQRLPPQPLAWFWNLIGCFGERLKIRMLFHSGRPAAGILTLRFGRTMTYKYGFSDKEFHRLGSVQLLLWKAIQEAKQEGLVEFDMGRSDWSNEGLVTFKDRWGCARTSIAYLRFPAKEALPSGSLMMRIARQLLAVAPESVLPTAGNVLYRHMA